MATSIVEQVSSSLPSGVDVHPAGQGAALLLWVNADPPGRSGFGFGPIATQPGDRMDNACTALQSFVNHLQDAVARHTTQPWPASSGAMPMPRLEVEGNRIQVWFEDPAGSRYEPRVSVEVE